MNKELFETEISLKLNINGVEVIYDTNTKIIKINENLKSKELNLINSLIQEIELWKIIQDNK